MLLSRRLLCAAAASSAGGGTTEAPPSKPQGRGFKRSIDAFLHKSKILTQKYSGDHAKQYIQPWEHLWYNTVRLPFTGQRLIGKDRWGNRFLTKYYRLKKRGEERLVQRIDSSLRHQPYGSLPIDDRLWEQWMRGFRGDPPTPEESENFRSQRTRHLGPRAMGEEESEDAIMRGLAHTFTGSAYMHELDPNQEANNFLNSEEKRQREAEKDSPWTMGFVRGDQFYNEEQTENLRTNMQSMFRDRQWQHLEMMRHERERQGLDYQGANKPKLKEDDPEPEPARGKFVRPDRGIPFIEGCPDLKTPELEKLRLEVEHLEERRLRIRKELGLSDVADQREDRPTAEVEGQPYAPEPCSKHWKPKCWGESWGIGNGHFT